MTRRRVDSIFLVILIAAIGVRLYGIGDSCYWLDEFDSMETSSGRGLAHVAVPRNEWLVDPPVLTTLTDAPSSIHIWTSLNLDNHPPLYFMLLRGWREIFGGGEAETRMLSAVFSMAALVMFYAIVRQQMPGEAALWATALMAVASSQVYFAQQTRGYALWDALAMLGCVALLHIQRMKPRPISWMIFFLAVLTILLTHYFAAATVASMLLISLVQMRGKKQLTCLMTIVSACIVYVAMWGRFLWQQRLTVGENNRWQVDVSDHHALATMQRICLLPVRWLSEGAVNQLAGAPGTILALLMLVIFIGVGIALRRRQDVVFWLIFLLPLVIGIATLDLLQQSRYLAVSRYTFVAGPAVFALLAASTTVSNRVGRFSGRAACLVALLVSIATLSGVYSQDQDWRQVASVLQNNVRSGDRIIYDSGGREGWWAGALYLGVSHYAPHLPANVLLLTDDHSPALDHAFSNGHSTWMLCAQPMRSPTFLFPEAKVLQETAVPDIGMVSQLTR